MSHYAKVVDGKVLQIIVADENFVKKYIGNIAGEQLVQTSYNTRGGVHYGEDGQPDGGVALRFNFAGVGFNYDAAADAFYPPRPFESWTLNTTTYLWEPPVACPADGKMYTWDEATKAWVGVD